MRAWVVRGDPGCETETLNTLLRQWASRQENNHWVVECQCLTPNLAAAVQTCRPDVLVLAEASCPAGPWTNDVLAHGVALLVATTRARAEPYRILAEQFAVHLMELPASVEALALALLNTLAGRQRQRVWQARVDQLQQRLNDRIVIERAKGILVQRLGISEKEAYKRLRVLSRRQRRQIRDIAQSLLDTQSLFSPESNGVNDLEHRDDLSAPDRSDLAL
jgi:AmiR/NasT family two-component response regulator